MEESKGQERGEGRECTGRVHHLKILRIPKKRFPGAWPWPCPRGALSSAQSCTPPQQPPIEVAGWSCEESWGGGETRVPPKAAHSQLWQEGRVGRVRERQRQEGDLEAEAGQQKGRALGTKAHLKICSALAVPPELGPRGTAAGHGSAWGDTEEVGSV